MAETSSTIRTTSQGVKRASGDQGSAEVHSIPDQIAADKYAQGNAAIRKTNPLAGLRYKSKPPGAGGG